jgi:D-alanine-D-alanine ligase
MKRLVVVAYNKVLPNAGPDELDIFDQVQLAEQCLAELGYQTERLEIDLNVNVFADKLKEIQPAFVFNLVESIQNHGELLYFATAIYDYLQIPYTGVPTNGMFLTTNKTLAKKWMRSNGIPTAPSFEIYETGKLNPDRTYLVKPKLEDGSLGFDDDLVFKGSDAGRFPKIRELSPLHFFIEEYLEGREFNVSVLGGKSGPTVLPVPEMNFHNFPEGKPKIMGFRAKWVENSFEYENTSRSFIDEEKEAGLVNKLREICLRCWDVFEIKGFCRVDFRLDKEGSPYVLEVNANPCISPGAGFYAACEHAGISFTEATRRMIEDAF